jgi:hypothetical protein
VWPPWIVYSRSSAGPCRRRDESETGEPPGLTVRPANDDNRTIWSGAFAWRRHWLHVLIAFFLAAAIPLAYTMFLR